MPHIMNNIKNPNCLIFQKSMNYEYSIMDQIKLIASYSMINCTENEQVIKAKQSSATLLRKN